MINETTTSHRHTSHLFSTTTPVLLNFLALLRFCCFWAGPIPSACSELTVLETLDLRSNSINGMIPDAIGQATSLTSLWLSSNEIKGQIPSSIGDSLANLRFLGMSKNHLEGPIPASFGNLQKLESLQLYDNLLEGVVPACMQHLTSLQMLVLWVSVCYLSTAAVSAAATRLTNNSSC